MLLLSHSRTLVWHTESCRQQTVNRLSSCNISCSAPCRHRLRRLPSYLPPLAAHFAALLAEQSSVALQERRSRSRSRRQRVVCCCIAYVASACSAVLHATVAFTVSCLIRLIKCANLLSSVQYSTVLRPHCLCASSQPLPLPHHALLQASAAFKRRSGNASSASSASYSSLLLLLLCGNLANWDAFMRYVIERRYLFGSSPLPLNTLQNSPSPGKKCK